MRLTAGITDMNGCPSFLAAEQLAVTGAGALMGSVGQRQGSSYKRIAALMCP
jgi:hypothetical protein